MDAATCLKDVFNVGARKPLGYIVRQNTLYYCGLMLENVEPALHDKGLRTLILGDHETQVYSGALYAWDEAALADRLQRHADILLRAGWPMQTEPLMRRVGLEIAPWGSQLCDMIADIFGEPADSAWRSHYREPVPNEWEGLIP